MPKRLHDFTFGTRRRRLRLWALIIMGLFVFLSVADTPAHARGARDVFRIRSPSFSPDSKFLVMDYLVPRKKAVLAIWDIEKEKLTKLRKAPLGWDWLTPSFSPDGSKIIFAQCKRAKRKKERRDCNIAVAERDGTNTQILTSSINSKYPWIDNPSFSPDGRKVISWRTTGVPGKGEIFELDVDTGNETQLTNFDFISVTGLQYLPDGRNFIFEGQTKATWDVDDIPPGNHILIMGPDYGRDLMPAFTRAHSTGDPSMSADGEKILFRSRTNDLDGIEHAPPNMDLFLRSNGENTRITNLGIQILYALLSPDGETVFFLADKARAMNWAPTSRRHVYGYWLMNSDGTNMREIRFPDQPQK